MQYLLQEVRLNLTWAQQEQPGLYRLIATVNILRWYLSPCLFAVGIICHILSIVTFTWKKFRQVSCVPYLIVASFVDISFLFTWLLVWLHIQGLDIYNVRGMCQAVALLSSVCNFLSVWCTTCGVLDRTVTLYTYPKFICTNLKAKLILGFFVATSLVVYVNISLLYGVIITYPDIKMCIPLPTSVTATNILTQMDAFFNFALPYTIIITANVFCYRKIKRHRVRRNTLICGEDLQRQISLPSFTEMDMNFTIFVSSTFFVILNLPGHLLRLYAFSQENDDPSQWIYHTKLLLWQQCLFYLTIARISGNFFVYLLNPMFKEYLHLMRFKCCDYLMKKLRPKKYSIKYGILSLPLYTLRVTDGDSESKSTERSSL